MRYFLPVLFAAIVYTHSVDAWRLDSAGVKTSSGLVVWDSLGKIEPHDKALQDLAERLALSENKYKELHDHVETVEKRLEMARNAMLCLIVVGVVVVAIKAFQRYYPKPASNESADDTFEDNKDQK